MRMFQVPLSAVTAAMLIGFAGIANAGQSSAAAPAKQPAAKVCDVKKQTCTPQAAQKVPTRSADEQVLKSQLYLSATKFGGNGQHRSLIASIGNASSVTMTPPMPSGIFAQTSWMSLQTSQCIPAAPSWEHMSSASRPIGATIRRTSDRLSLTRSIRG